jgi:hypothetical protein
MPYVDEIHAKAQREADLYDKENLFETPEEKKGFTDGFSTGYLASLTDIRNGLVDLDMIQRLLDDGRRHK